MNERMTKEQQQQLYADCCAYVKDKKGTIQDFCKSAEVPHNTFHSMIRRHGWKSPLRRGSYKKRESAIDNSPARALNYDAPVNGNGKRFAKFVPVGEDESRIRIVTESFTLEIPSHDAAGLETALRVIKELRS